MAGYVESVRDALFRRSLNLPHWLIWLDAQVLTNGQAPLAGVMVGWIGLTLFFIAPACVALRDRRQLVQAGEHSRRHDAGGFDVPVV